MPNVGPYIYIYIYTTLAFLALLGAPYIYDISSLRVNAFERRVSLSFLGKHPVGESASEDRERLEPSTFIPMKN